MQEDDPGLEQRLSRFEAQLDRFSLTLQHWQQTQDRTPPADLHDVDRRIRTLEETIDREADTLRRLHEEPLKQLQAEAASLREICLAASHSVDGLDQSESRLAALQTDMHLRLKELTGTLQALVTDLQARGSSAVSVHGPGAPWAIDRVMDLHEELRRAEGEVHDSTYRPASGGAVPPFPRETRALPAATEALAERVQMLEHEVSAEKEEASREAERQRRQRKWQYGAAALLLLAAVIVAAVGERRIQGRLNDAVAQVSAAERQAAAATELANQQVAAARETADRQIAEARQSAQRAETIGNILTAPDLVRFNLTGGPNGQRSSAQLLWSRSRGLVLSASRLPAAPPESVYQLWLWTSADPVSGGLFVPDASGGATLVSAVPPKVVGPVIGVAVTVERSGGRQVPSGPTVLTRLPLS
jgi:hypothetical protein